MVETAATCSKCSASLAADEQFCPACGQPRQTQPAQLYSHITQGPTASGQARKWLLAIAILTLLSGVVMYFLQSSEVEKTLAQLDLQLAGIEPAERDQLLKQETGMTYQQVVDHDRGMVKLLLAVNIGLSIFYFGMWIWAKRNALTASVLALLMFVTVTAISGVLEPSSLYKGIIIKVLFVVALSKAIGLALQERAARTA